MAAKNCRIRVHGSFWLLCSVHFFFSALTAMAEDKPPTYEDHVLPVFREKCCSCHNADRKAGGARFDELPTNDGWW